MFQRDITEYLFKTNPRYKSEMITFLVAQGFTHGLTLHWHNDIKVDKATKTLKHLDACVNKELLGRRFNESPERIHAVHFFEGLEGATLHVHSLWQIASKQADHFEDLFEASPGKNGLWKRLVPSGTHKMIPNRYPFAAAAYDTKCHHMWSDPERMVFSSEFHPSLKQVAG